MKNNLIIIPIIIAAIVIITLSATSFEEPNGAKIDVIINKELEHEVTPEIQEKLDEVEKNVEDSNNLETNYDPFREREWITSGPFQIDRSEYALGENIFIRMNALDSTEKGQIAFMRPQNSTHYSVYFTIPFDGGKTSFNQYFSPDLSKTRGICSVEDIEGEWTVVFRGTDYDNIKFRVSSDMIVPGEESRYEPIC